MAVAAIGLSTFRTRRGVIYAIAAIPLVLAVWLSGSRTALAGTGLGVIGLLIVRHREGALRLIRERKRLIAIATILIVAIGMAVIYPSGRNVSVRYSIWARAELVRTALDMLADRPLLGVGVSRFYDLFPQYASPELRQAFFESALIPVVRENAHNNFLQILAELGLVGFAAFVLILAAGAAASCGGARKRASAARHRHRQLPLHGTVRTSAAHPFRRLSLLADAGADGGCVRRRSRGSRRRSSARRLAPRSWCSC